MGRAVGGAGAGCAGFGLLGVLVSVAIVVWLGSQGLGGGGDGDDGAPVRPTDAAALLDALDRPPVLANDQPYPVGSPTPFEAAPVPPGVATVSVCAPDAPVPAGEAPDPATCAAPLASTTVGADGVLSAEVTFAATIDRADGTQTDCRPGACVVVIDPAGEGPVWASALRLAAP